MLIVFFLGWLACSGSQTASLERTPEELAKLFIENLGDIEKVKSLFPSADVANAILTCEGENQIIHDKTKIFQKLDANANQFKGMETSLQEIKLTETKDFKKGFARKNCSFNETIESRKYVLTAKLVDQNGETTQKSRRVIMIEWKAKWYFISI